MNIVLAIVVRLSRILPLVLILCTSTLLALDPLAPDTESVYTPTQEPVTVFPNRMEFVTIPSGSFMMGSPTTESGRESNEDQHRVTVSSFELMTTEVTQGMWQEVMGSNPARDYGVGDYYPIYNVSWNDCQGFIDELNDLDPSNTYRLPTEAEWEYACRAGTTTAYYWGDGMNTSRLYYTGNSNGSNCWYMANSNSSTHPVKQKLRNAWGLYDMSGNVWEWCEDVYTSNYEECPANGTANAGSGSIHVIRGGSWYHDVRYCRSACRLSGPGTSNNRVGFRLVRSAR